ncbi:MAG: hypothetical protein V4736_10675 [Bdellovibrionota bacterium]
MKVIKAIFFAAGLIAFLFLIVDADARGSPAVLRKEKTVPCDDAKTQKIHVAFGRLTILSFPVAPKDVLPGENNFDFKQIKNDLAVKSLRFGSKTNVFIYLAERRCAFDLVTVPSGGDDIVFVRDPKDKQLQVDFK